jgi:uncharacterized DUF497 family protein
MDFNWDDGNAGKCQKHGLTPAEIEFALGTGARFAASPVHSLGEQCLIAILRRPRIGWSSSRPAGGTAASAR